MQDVCRQQIVEKGEQQGRCKANRDVFCTTITIVEGAEVSVIDCVCKSTDGILGQGERLVDLMCLTESVRLGAPPNAHIQEYAVQAHLGAELQQLPVITAPAALGAEQHARHMSACMPEMHQLT